MKQDMAAKRTIFLDKDGTLIPDIPYNVDTRLITLSPCSIQGLKKLQSRGFTFIVVTNQSGIAEKRFSHESVCKVGVRLKVLLEEQGINLLDFYYCPHAATDHMLLSAFSCKCRKPKAGMLLQAASDHDIDLHSSWMIGDILNDVQAGNAAGCKTILVDNGNETVWKMDWKRVPDMIVPTIDAAAQFIIGTDG
jgi:D-glycero-D-manno-heptose 1,7-bisphosphate phosphatase